MSMSNDHEGNSEFDPMLVIEALKELPDGVLVLGPDDKIIFCNERQKELFPGVADLFVPGTSFETLVRESVSRGLIAESAGREEEWIAARMAMHLAGDRVRFEQEHADGTWAEVHEIGLANGCRVGIRTDITERKRAEEALRASEERYHEVIASTQEGYWRVDAEARTIEVNDALCQMLGYAREEIVGRRSYDFVDEENRARLEAQATRSAEADQRRYEVTFRAKDGSDVYVEFNATTLRDSDGEITGSFAFLSDITARKRGEEAQRKLARAVEQSPVSVVITDINGAIEYANPKFSEISGYSFEEVRGKNPRLLKSGKTPPEIYEDLWRTILRGDTWTGEMLNRAKGGDLFWERQTISGVTDEQGRVTNFVAVKEDVTEVKKRESELAENSALLRTILDTVPANIVVRDNEDRFTFMNRRACEFYGKPIEAMLGKTTEELLGNDYPTGFDDFISRIRASDGLVSEPNYKSTRHPGRTLWLLGAPIARSDGDILGTVSVHLDVTEHKRAEEALRRSDERLLEAIAHVTEGFSLWDSDLHLVYCNAEFVRLSGLADDGLEPGTSYEEYIRKCLLRQAIPEAQGRIESWVSERLRELQDRSHELRLKEIIRDERRYLRRDVPLPDGDLIVSVADIEDLKRAEEQLSQAQRLEAIGQLTGGIAHDFNNLLAIILGNLQLLERRIVLPDGDQEHLRQSLMAVERGAALTHRLLAFARSQPLQPRAVNVDDVINGMKDMLRRTLSEAIDLNFDLNDGLPVMVDVQQLENALLNLAINARDAMMDGGTLTIKTSDRTFDGSEINLGEEIAAGNYCLISVSDTGAGMDEITLNRVFEPFFTTKEFGKGSGLGLSMVQGFVRQSGGHVGVHSEAGVGTTVQLYLPLAGMADKDESGANEDDAEKTRLGQGQVVLVLEDDERLLQTAVNMLESLGYVVLQAGDAASTMALLDGDDAVDLLFCDVVLPGGASGPEIAAEAQEKFPALKVLYCTGYADNVLTRDGRLKPGLRLLSKPYSLETLAEAVHQALSDSS